MSPTVGYARVSSFGQDLEVQLEKLKQAGCAKIFREKRSGVDTGRPQLREALEYLREAAVDRLGHKRTFHTLSPSRHHHPPFGHDHLGNSNRINEHVLQKDVSDSLDTICAIEVQKANIRTALFVSETLPLEVAGRCHSGAALRVSLLGF